MTFNFNDAEPQRDFGELIPAKTYAKVQMSIRLPQGADVGDMAEFTRSKPPSDAQFLSCEFKILSDPLKNRMFWQNIMIARVSDKALNISKATLRAMLESARGIMPTDMSDLALRARQVQSFSEFQDIIFAVRIDIEIGNEGFNDKNKIGIVITPDRSEYKSIMAGQTIVGTTPPANNGIRKQRQSGASQQPQQQHQWPSATATTEQSLNDQPLNSPIPGWAK